VRRRYAIVPVALASASLALAACGSVSAGAALKSWSTSSNLTTNSAQLVLDARHVLSALDDVHSTPAQLHTVCAVLDLETLQANSALPAPDNQTTTLLSAAYTDLGDGANECYIAGASPLKRAKAAAFLKRGGAELSEAQARVTALVSS
jgi:hypothetical protein